MITGLSIHQHIRQALLSSEALRSRVGERIYSIAAVNGTAYPFVLCTRTAVVPDYTKDGWSGDQVTVTIEVVSRSSTEAVAIAEDVREALEEATIEHIDYTVSETALIAATEGYDLDSDTYVEALQFSIKIS